jgi:hypothetical protein
MPNLIDNLYMNNVLIADTTGHVISNVQQGIAFFVDDNAGLDTNDGLSWGTAVKTIAAAIALADDDIAKTNHWNRRNRIYVDGGAYTESLVRFPEKTDIIGVGSTDWLGKAKLIGVQVPATAVMGCRWFNMAFQNVTAAETVKLAASNHGAAFIDCDFIGNATTTVGLLSTNNVDLIVKNCRFYAIGDGSGTAGTALQLVGIQIAGTLTNINAQIIGNHIRAAVGITVTGSMTGGGIIANNIIECTTLAIDDDSDLMFVADNHWISAANHSASYDLEVTRCIGNLATGNGDGKTMYVPIITLT